LIFASYAVMIELTKYEPPSLEEKAMYVFIIFFTLILLYFLIENRVNRACLASFKTVIHVNGIRGKTSTCRCIDAALRTRYKVFTKTTGTDAMMIHTDGTETPVRRLGPANIHEQLRIIRKARREGAEILILECMAVNPELQKIAQEQIVRSSITVITNVRYDHVFEMGDTLEEIAQSLSSTIPQGGTLYTADSRAAALFREKCGEKDCRLVLCTAESVAQENISIAREVAASLGVTGEEFNRSLSAVREDFGTRRIYRMKNRNGEVFHFLNLFSANDPQSTKNNVDDAGDGYSNLYFLYNHREDRPDRALLFARYFFPHYKEHTVFLTGKGAFLPKRLFSGAGLTDLRVTPDYRDCLDLPEGSLLIGIGNIKGPGYEMIKTLEERGGSDE
jgi:gamma-polyglutamate synthase